MEINVISTNEEKLFNRKEICFSIVSLGRTASKDEAKVELCKKLNLKPDSTVITRMDQQFGVRQCLCYAHSYANEAEMRKSEPGYLMKRSEKKPEGAEPAEEKGAAKEEKKKEEKKDKKKEVKEEKAE